jgi:hypothetical protein
MVLQPFGIAIVARRAHPSNAHLPMAKQPGRKATAVRDVQLQKADLTYGAAPSARPRLAEAAVEFYPSDICRIAVELARLRGRARS